MAWVNSGGLSGEKSALVTAEPLVTLGSVLLPA